MKRVLPFTMLMVLAFADVGREAYRDAYRAWREAGPTLERDAAAASPAFGADADRVARQAAKYAASRAAFLSQSAGEMQQKLGWLEQAPAQSPGLSQGADTQVIASETTSVRHSLAAYGNDPDPGIQQVRNMLQRENLALGSLSSALADGRKAAEAVKSAAAAEEQARLKALNAYRDAVAALTQEAGESNREGAAWAEYYRKLSDSARAPAAAAPPSPVASPAPRQPAVPITPLPLARYTGPWTFPAINGLFHGPQPELVELMVTENNGRAEGTLVARFKGTGGDPVLRFNFSGEFKNMRNQTFNLETTDGAKGTIELIPGPAFNLLEINFQTEPRPGKVQQGNVVLVKK